MGFEWDKPKRARNLKDHGVDFIECEGVFEDPLALIRSDFNHSNGEHRLIIVGRSRKGRLLLTVFAERGTEIRIISSRRATRREVRDYEKGV